MNKAEGFFALSALTPLAECDPASNDAAGLLTEPARRPVARQVGL
ncbi:MAG TPA: hypothetical protein VF598_03135 [Hymenobacter sp.]